MVRTFNQTSDKPYTRHNYRAVLKDGRNFMCQDYEYLSSFWCNFKSHMEYVEVIDIPEDTAGKGF